MQIDRVRLSKIPADQLRSLANIIPLEKTSQWYGNLGRVLRNAGHLNAAMEEFGTAITILDSWEWQASLASCHAQLGDYPAAIKLGSKALGTPDHMRRTTTLTDIADWYLALPTPDVSRAIQSAKEAHSLDSADMRTIAIYLKTLYAGHFFQQMVDLVEVIVRASQASPHNPLITKFLQFQVHKMIGIAAQQVKQPDLIYNALTASIASCEEQKDFTRAAAQRYILALALLRLQNRNAEAMALMEQVFQEVKDNKYTSPRWYLRKGSIDRLSQFYFDNARKAEDDGDDFGEWISKLQALAMHSKAASRGFKWYSTNTASLMLGLWHVLHNRRKEAKACMKGLILEALDLLRDNDPTNDITGYHVLGQSLLFFGDEVNAVGAFALINAPFEKLKVNRALLKSSTSVTLSSNTHTHDLSSTQVETSVIAPNTPPRSSTIPGASLFAAAEKLEEQAQTWTPAMFYECQNGCDENIDRFKACYACRTCFKKYHCDECMKKILTSGAVFFNCTPTHKLFQVYPLPDSIVDVEVMRIGGEKVSRTQWLAGLRREWLDDGFVMEPSAVPKNETLGILPS